MERKEILFPIHPFVAVQCVCGENKLRKWAVIELKKFVRFVGSNKGGFA